jgi:hypothetical protein
MLNEGIVLDDAKTLMKSEMIHQIRKLGETDPETWERAVFEAITGQKREDVDWAVEDNHAGYYLWVKTFDQLIGELIDDGYVRDQATEGDRRILAPRDDEPDLDVSRLVYPSAIPSS